MIIFKRQSSGDVEMNSRPLADWMRVANQEKAITIVNHTLPS